MSEELVKKVEEAVSKVLDPHMGISIVQMGLVQDISVDGDQAKIVIKPTNPGCMSVARMGMQARLEAEKVEGIEKAVVEVKEHMMCDTVNEMINQDLEDLESKKEEVEE